MTGAQGGGTSAPRASHEGAGPSRTQAQGGRLLAIILGTGYLDALKGAVTAGAARLEPCEVETVDGAVRAGLWRLSVGASRAIVLSRHGEDGGRPAHRIPHRAHLRGLAQLGVTHVASFTSAGSLNPRVKVGTFVVPDDFFDGGHGIVTFDDPALGYTPMGRPFDPGLAGFLAARLEAPQIQVILGGTYCGVPGPRYPTFAEGRQLARVGTLSGMTAVPEAILAAELGLKYANCTLVTDAGTDVSHARISEAAPASRRHVSDVIASLAPAFAAWDGALPSLATRVRHAATVRLLRVR